MPIRQFEYISQTQEANMKRLPTQSTRHNRHLSKLVLEFISADIKVKYSGKFIIHHTFLFYLWIIFFRMHKKYMKY